jgi:ABC-type amino acid transport substrate-binding protein
MNRLEDLKPYLPKELQNEQEMFNLALKKVNNDGFIITQLDSWLHGHKVVLYGQ